MKKYLVFLMIIFCLAFVASIREPFGAEVTPGNSSRANATDPQSAPAQAGNVTELNIFGYSITQSWQGYFGNVSGTLTLSNSAGDAMYNWSVASPRGQIYASVNNSLQWQYVQCFNYTSFGDFEDDKPQAGNTSLNGLNLTQLEDMFNIPRSAVDGVDETFNLFGVDGHRSFYTSSMLFGDGQCPSTRVFGSAGSQNKNEFEEVLLYEPESKSIVFTSLLNENLQGFDGKSYDFQMLVLEDGRGTNTETTNYYFYLEIE